jgi:hypothetical protein
MVAILEILGADLGGVDMVGCWDRNILGRLWRVESRCGRLVPFLGRFPTSLRYGEGSAIGRSASLGDLTKFMRALCEVEEHFPRPPNMGEDGYR